MTRKIITSKPYNRGLLKTIKTYYLDLRYGLKLLDEEKESTHIKLGCHHTQSTEYDEIEKIFSPIVLDEKTVIMDVGCGRGRLFNYLLKKGFSGKMIGVEIDPEIADFTRKRLEKYRNIKVITGDAIDYINGEVSIYFLFNPFNENCLESFVEKVENEHREVMLIYFNALYTEMIRSRKGWRVESKMHYSNSRERYIPCAYLKYRASVDK